MACDATVFADIPIFSLLDADERAVLAEHVELRRFGARERIYKIGDPGERAYVIVRGKVDVVMLDEDNQEVVIDRPGMGEIFGLASMLSASPHQTTAVALEDTAAVEIDRTDIAQLLQRKPMAGLDMLTMVGRQFRAAQDLVRMRAARNPNEVIDEQLSFGDAIADRVAQFGGSWAPSPISPRSTRSRRTFGNVLAPDGAVSTRAGRKARLQPRLHAPHQRALVGDGVRR